MDEWARKKVEKEFIKGLEPGESFRRENWNLMELSAVATLLRAERARTRRMVKAMRNLNRHGALRGFKGTAVAGYYQALDDLLTRLAGRT